MATKTKRKVRRFAEGGSDNYDPDQDAADQIANESFGAAFKRNRAGGNKTFMWRGKKYTTDVAGPKATQDSTSGGPPTRARRDSPKSEWSGAIDTERKFSGTPSRMTSLLRDTASGSPMGIRRSMGASEPESRKDWPKLKKGGKVKKYARGGGIESRGKTKGRFV
jgi:hypothetical protein